MKIRITVSAEIETDISNYPDAKTLADVVRMNQEHYDTGALSLSDLLGEDFIVLIEAVDEGSKQ